MTSRHSYDTYSYWSFVPPSVVSGILFLGVLVAMKVFALSKFIKNQCRCCQYFVDPLFHFVKVTFGGHIKKIEGSQKFTFYCYEISSSEIIMLSTATLMILGPTFLSFWVSFIVNETFVCDPKLDCFLHNSSSSDHEPLYNCTSYDSTDGTVGCFEFVFDLTKGFSSAVGFMGVGVVYCRLYTFIMIWLWEFCSNKCQMDCTRCVTFIMQMVISIIFILIFIVVNAVPLFSDVVFKTNKSGAIFIAYWICFFYIGPFAGFYVSLALIGARKVTTSNNAQVTSEEENPLLGASVNRSNYTNLPQDT